MAGSAACLLLALLLAACLRGSAALQPQQVLDAADAVPTVVAVNSSAALFEALQQVLPAEQELVVLLEGDLDLSDAWWAPDAPLAIGPNQTVVIRGELSGPLDLASPEAIPQAGAPTINWARKEGVLQVEPGGTLVLDGVVSQNVAPIAPWRARVQPPVEITRIALQPSALFSIGSTLALHRSLINYLSTDCSPNALNDLVWRYRVGQLNSTQLAQPNATEYSVNGTALMGVTAVKAGDSTEKVGSINLILSDMVSNCNVDPEASPVLPEISPNAASSGSGSGDGGGGVAGWVWALVGLGAAGLLAAALVGAVVALRRRRRRRHGQGPALPVMVTPPGSGGLRLAVVRSGDAAAGPEGGKEGSSPKSPDKDADGSTEFSVGVLGQLQAAWQARLGEIQGLELLHVLDRGGFASVFKGEYGRWCGATVAVKLVEHEAGGETAAQIQREAALATSVSHPNVVSTYKVVTLAAPELRRMQPQLGSSLPQPATPHPSPASAAAGPALGASRGALPGLGGNNPPWTQPEGSAHSTGPSTAPHLSLDLDRAESSAGEGQLGALAGARSDGAGGEAAGSGHSNSTGPCATLCVMEYCDRGSLEGALLRRELLWRPDGSPDQEAILRLLLDTALALEYLHSVGIIHGDVKSGNVLLKSVASTRRGWCAKVSDFGLSRMLEVAQTSIQTSVLGTAAYMAPELMSGGKTSRAADVYSFGILIWEAWEGRHAFEQLPLPLLSYQVAHLGHRPPVPPSCPPAYAELMQRCWRQEPHARPCFGEVLGALRDLLAAALGSGGGDGGCSPDGSPRVARPQAQAPPATEA